MNPAKTKVSTVDIPTGWDPRTKQQRRVALADFSAAPWRGFENQNAAPTAPPCFSHWLRSSPLHWADCLPCLRQGRAVRIPPGPKASAWLMCTQKKSNSVKITLLLKVDLEGFEPLTSRMRTERSPSNIAFVHTLHTVRKGKSTYIRPYKTLCHPNGLLLEQV